MGRPGRQHGCRVIFCVGSLLALGAAPAKAGKPGFDSETGPTSYFISDPATALIVCDWFGAADIAWGLEFGTTTMPLDSEFGVKVDRSYNDLFVKLGVTFDLRQRWRAKLGTKYRVRECTTNGRADTARYERTDDFWAIEAEVGKWFRKDLYFGVLAGWARNDSDHRDVTLGSDEAGYEEFIVGLVAQWRF